MQTFYGVNDGRSVIKFADNFVSAIQLLGEKNAQDLCLPKNFCTWDRVARECVGKTGVFTNLTQRERDITCSYAGKDVDCPTGGCAGFSVKLPDKFVASDQTTANNSTPVKGLAICFLKDADDRSVAGNGFDPGLSAETTGNQSDEVREHRQDGFPDSALCILLFLCPVRRCLRLALASARANFSIPSPSHGPACCSASRASHCCCGA
jgi:hypothetical protein